jgi:hypothetical protein
VSRGKKPKPPKAPAGRAGRRWRAARPVVAVVLTLAVVGAVVAGLGWLGDAALRGVGSRDRYRVSFADIDCNPPPGIDRPTFLAEVRYVGTFPETFNPLDPADQQRLTAAFAAHPWVAAVDEVAAEPGGVVRVRLTFRTAVLAVRIAGGPVRLVDGHGVLLPVSAAPPGVAELANPVPAPTTAAGLVWADDTVARAVELVAVYHPRRLEKTPRGWRLTRADGKVLSVER